MPTQVPGQSLSLLHLLDWPSLSALQLPLLLHSCTHSFTVLQFYSFTVSQRDIVGGHLSPKGSNPEKKVASFRTLSQSGLDPLPLPPPPRFKHLWGNFCLSWPRKYIPIKTTSKQPNCTLPLCIFLIMLLGQLPLKGNTITIIITWILICLGGWERGYILHLMPKWL